LGREFMISLEEGRLTMKILLAIDGSTFSDAAVQEVASRPWPRGSEVRIISVVEPTLMPTIESWVPPDDYIEGLERTAEAQAQSVVGKAADRIHKQQGDNLRVIAQVIRGHAKHEITSEAEDWGADLILMGSHGYRGLTKLWLGSVSQAVSSHARCSVEIARNPAAIS
jgi:nucleotide-binding universal stress UspA family protein